MTAVHLYRQSMALQRASRYVGYPIIHRLECKSSFYNHRPSYQCVHAIHTDSGQWNHPESPYDILKASASDTQDELKNHFLELSKTFHPDKTLQLPDEERKQRHIRYLHIQAAYKLLRNPVARDAYDRGLAATRPGYMPTKDHYGDAPIHPTVGGFVYPWFLGVTFLGILSFIWIDNSHKSRLREEDLAWKLFRRQRRAEGLEDVVGMTTHRRR
ncbi:hypothetical protein BASA60_008818 [Batrachochytrium salamandrivorans]|nr:hypothetical protein BASA60_008818 [Batrachochytrium salamandrivorans]